jgi:carbonic anhydrase/acetyltransferase-like protein (isoleucine patch superfamily)
MLIEHLGKRPNIHESAFIAPTAVICGAVTIGANTHVGFGAVISAEGGSVIIGAQSIIRENVVIRGTSGHAVQIGDYVLIGARSALYGCRVEDEAFLATGVTIFQGARIGKGAEVRINGVVHVNSVLPQSGLVPIGWIAVGNPAEVLPPGEHERIWMVQKDLNFAQTVYGVESSPDGSSVKAENADMNEITRRVAEGLAKHRDDQILDER